MKKLVLFAAVAAFMVSCKKEYTCECTISGGFINGTVSETYPKMKKKDAEKKCDENDSSESGVTVACSIK